MRSGNHLNGFVGSRTSNQSRTQPLNAFRTKNFWYLGDIDEENGDDTIEFIADLSSKCRVRLSSQRVAICFLCGRNNNGNLLPVKAMIEITLFNFWQDIIEELSSMSFVLTRFFFANSIPWFTEHVIWIKQKARSIQSPWSTARNSIKKPALLTSTRSNNWINEQYATGSQ